MNRIAGIAILIVGIVLVGWGISASDSVGSAFSRLFTGAPTDKSIILLIGGVLIAAAGIGALFYPAGRRA